MLFKLIEYILKYLKKNENFDILFVHFNDKKLLIYIKRRSRKTKM